MSFNLEEQLLLLPAKAVSVGASLCLKKAYFSTLIDTAPTTHYPVDVSSRDIHDVLASAVVPVTYDFFRNSYKSVNSYVKERLHNILDEVIENVELYSNFSISENRKNILKERAAMFIRGYLTLLRAHAINQTPRVYAERHLMSVTHNFPVVGVPDVVVDWGGHVLLIDWKLTDKYYSTKAFVYQVIVYQLIIQSVVDGVKVCPYVVHVTRKKNNIKVIGVSDGCKLQHSIFIEEGVEYVNTSADVANSEERLRAVVQVLKNMITNGAYLREAFDLIKKYGLRAPKNVLGRDMRPVYSSKLCKNCYYLTFCAYRFTKSSKLPEDLRKIKRSFNKMFRTALQKKSVDNLIKADHCVRFDRLYFKDIPTSLYVEANVKKFRDVKEGLGEVMKFVKGRSPVYLFLCGDFLGHKACNRLLNSEELPVVVSPNIFGRFEGDEVDYENGVVKARVSMISPSFANKWIPLYYLYKSQSDLFKHGVVVCKGSVPLDLELKAISTVENDIVARWPENLKTEFEKLVYKLISEVSDEVA